MVSATASSMVCAIPWFGMRAAVHWVSRSCVYSAYPLSTVHAHILFTFVAVLVGQVMNRLKLNWFGKLGNVALLLALTLAYYLLDFSLGIYTPLADIDENGILMIASLNSHVFYWRAFFGLLFGIVTMVLVCQVRRRVRERHNIPGNACEDCCCAYWCTCCVAAQMARHTADYDTYAGQCCSETGLPSHAPSVV